MRIAIAGGTSPTLGASITTALLSAGHTPIILTRQTNQPSTHPSGTQIRPVDYTDRASLAAALHDIDTLISVLLIPSSDMITHQLNLLHAAIAAGVKRFAPSEFALPPSSQRSIDFDQAKLAVWDAVQRAVENGQIDAARFPSGMWMNYLGIGCRFAQEEALAGFAEGPFLVHLADEKSPGPWVEVPVRDDGTYPPITMTDLRDIGRFVVAAVEMEDPWAGQTLGMAGDTVEMRELVSLCERYVGRPVEAREVKEAELMERLDQLPEEKLLARMECQLAMVGCRDGLVVPPTLNALCSVQPTTIRGFMEKYWNGPQ